MAAHAQPIIFAGTPPFAATLLAAMLEHGFTPSLVLTQPDRPSGRGKKLSMSAVKQLALAQQLPILQPNHFRDQAALEPLQALQPAVIIVVAYGCLLPQSVLDLPRYGCVNVHASLLPRWRGAAPINYAIWEQDAQTGISIMQMDQGLDTGPVITQATLDIDPNDTTASLTQRLASLGATTLLETLPYILSEQITLKPQPSTGVRHAPKIQKQHGLIDWHQSAVHIDHHVRAMNAWPVAYCICQQQRVRIWQGKAIAMPTDKPPGTIIAQSKQGLDIATHHGCYRIQEAQLPGGKRCSIAELLNAHQSLFQVGALFGEVS